MPREQDLLPLKDLVFRILVALADGERHGWALMEQLNEHGGTKVLPGHLYRTLDRMLHDRLIEERDEPSAPPTPTPGKRGTAPRRFMRLTPFGCDVTRAETRRLQSLIERSRAGKVLRQRR